MPGRGPGPSIRDPQQYEAVKESYRRDHPNASEQEVKEHAAAISNASARRRRFRRGKRA
jgi:hypothetical protein